MCQADDDEPVCLDCSGLCGWGSRCQSCIGRRTKEYGPDPANWPAQAVRTVEFAKKGGE